MKLTQDRIEQLLQDVSDLEGFTEKVLDSIRCARCHQTASEHLTQIRIEQAIDGFREAKESLSYYLGNDVA